jgi:hypothetical protein
LDPKFKDPTYNFDNGISSTTRVKHFRGNYVSVREFTSTSVPINEAKTILEIPSHPCLPLLTGLCCELQPYLLVSKLYGSRKFGVMLCISAALAQSKRQKELQLDWLSILYCIAEGLLHMHTNGFVHGDLQSDDVILYKKAHGIFQPVFFSLHKARKLSFAEKENRRLIMEDLKMFAKLAKQILETATLDSRVFIKINNIICGEQLQILENVARYLVKTIV